MARLVRPYIPLTVRLQVVTRQMKIAGLEKIADTYLKTINLTKSQKLKQMLGHLGLAYQAHLDHDPPLCNRQRYADTTGIHYEPGANDPDYLIYRKVEDHRTKTFVRGEGALRSDMAQRRYLKRVAKNRKPKREFKPRRAKQIRRLPHAFVPMRSD